MIDFVLIPHQNPEINHRSSILEKGEGEILNSKRRKSRIDQRLNLVTQNNGGNFNSANNLKICNQIPPVSNRLFQDFYRQTTLLELNLAPLSDVRTPILRRERPSRSDIGAFPMSECQFNKKSAYFEKRGSTKI